MNGSTHPFVPRWLHAWAVLTALAALPLVTLGAEVTTKGVGMADPAGFRAPWYLFGLDLRQTPVGLLIEHSHRLAGFVVGICCIVLALGTTFFCRGVLFRSLGWLALLMVGAQGVLGIKRVDLHLWFGPELAFVHGCFAQLTFATLVAVAVLTSRSWARPLPATEGARGLRRLAVALAVTVFVQIVFGAVTRHLTDRVAQRLHLLLAFVIVALFVVLAREAWALARNDRGLRRVLVGLSVLLCIQPLLGVEAWMRRFGTTTLPDLVHSSPMLDLARSGHQVVGTLLFSGMVALTLLLYRPALGAVVAPALPQRKEGAA